MPELVRLYIRNVLAGFGLATAFVGLLLWLDVANLQHLIFATRDGWLALFLLVFFHGLVFAGVQFGIAVMSMAEKPEAGGGTPAPLPMATRCRASRCGSRRKRKWRARSNREGVNFPRA